MKNTFFSSKLQKVVSTIDYLIATMICFFSGNVSIRSQKGVTLIEYAMLAGLISVAVITAVQLIGTDLKLVFAKITTALAAM